MGATGETKRLRRLARRLEYATIAWNVGEAVFTILLGTIAGSLALVGFGSVSVIEVFASAVVVWHMRPGSEIGNPHRTSRALRLVAMAFGLLGVILIVTGTRDLLIGRRPEGSPLGIAYLALTAVAMFFLAASKRRIGLRLGAAPLVSEAAVTFLDGLLAAATAVGLALNAWWGLWWADPLAGLLVGFAALAGARQNRGMANVIAAKGPGPHPAGE